MSRTYNTKHDHDKKFCDYEFPQGFMTQGGKEIESGEIISYDPSFTTYGDNEYTIINDTSVRHPNKRKKRGSLGREFTKADISGTRYWRNRYGEANQKSSRGRLIKREQNQIRRQRMKEDTNKLIENSLEDYE